MKSKIILDVRTKATPRLNAKASPSAPANTRTDPHHAPCVLVPQDRRTSRSSTQVGVCLQRAWQLPRPLATSGSQQLQCQNFDRLLISPCNEYDVVCSGVGKEFENVCGYYLSPASRRHRNGSPPTDLCWRRVATHIIRTTMIYPHNRMTDGN